MHRMLLLQNRQLWGEVRVGQEGLCALDGLVFIFVRIQCRCRRFSPAQWIKQLNQEALLEENTTLPLQVLENEFTLFLLQ